MCMPGLADSSWEILVRTMAQVFREGVRAYTQARPAHLCFPLHLAQEVVRSRDGQRRIHGSTWPPGPSSQLHARLPVTR